MEMPIRIESAEQFERLIEDYLRQRRNMNVDPNRILLQRSILHDFMHQVQVIQHMDWVRAAQAQQAANPAKQFNNWL